MLRNNDKISLFNRHSDKRLRRGGKTTRSAASRRKYFDTMIRLFPFGTLSKEKRGESHCVISTQWLGDILLFSSEQSFDQNKSKKKGNTSGPPLPKMLPRRMMLLLFNGHASSSASSLRVCVCDANLSDGLFSLMFIREREWARNREVSTCTV